MNGLLPVCLPQKFLSNCRAFEGAWSEERLRVAWRKEFLFTDEVKILNFVAMFRLTLP